VVGACCFLRGRAGRIPATQSLFLERFGAQLLAAATGETIEISSRVASVDDGRMLDGRFLDADVIRPMANSTTARTAGLMDPERVLWGFAVRGYMSADVAVPTIALWNDRRGEFPSYVALPWADGANLGLGVGLGCSRLDAHRAQNNSPRSAHLVRIRLIDSTHHVPLRLLGGWLKMGLVGTRPTEGKVLLVSDALGLVNPLQGEGISVTGWRRAAVRCCLARPSRRPHIDGGSTRRTASGCR
jgi:flavin-dependent dehydrogenase